MEERTSAPRFVTAASTTFTARRIDAITAKFYSICLALTAFEVFVHASEQTHLLNPILAAVGLGSILVAVAGFVIFTWTVDASGVWYVVHALTVVANLAIWPFSFSHHGPIPAGFTPFLYWTLGWGCISAGLGLQPILAAAYILIVPTWFSLLVISPYGGSTSISQAAQDGVYTFLTSAVVVSVIYLLRRRAADQDRAFDAQATAKAKAAATEAVAKERLRLASLVHNDVLAALAMAVDAQSEEQKVQAKHAAEVAIAKLNEYSSMPEEPEDKVQVSNFAASLEELISREYPEFAVSSNIEGKFKIPVDVSQALAEALLQAVANSKQHAGPAGTKRRVKIEAKAHTLKLVVADDGRGFRMARVPRNRMGIRLLIQERVSQLGGQVKIDTWPGEGTNVVISWSAE